MFIWFTNAQRSQHPFVNPYNDPDGATDCYVTAGMAGESGPKTMTLELSTDPVS